MVRFSSLQPVLKWPENGSNYCSFKIKRVSPGPGRVFRQHLDANGLTFETWNAIAYQCLKYIFDTVKVSAYNTGFDR